MQHSFDPDVYRDQLYTAQQSRLLTNLPRVTAPLSIVGSSMILYIILSDRQRKLKHVYHRLLLAYSAIDVVCSFNYALSALVVPRGTPGVWGAQGNVATCEASGFITQFSLSLGVYGTFIPLYYVLVLRYQVREKTLAQYVEPWVHAFALITPLVMGSIMIWRGNYNPTNVIVGWCFINVYPMDCLRNDEIECERGAGYEKWLIANNVPFFVFFVVVFVSSILTFLKVRRIELRGARWSFAGDTRRSRSSQRRVRETATQACLYISAFFVTYIFFGIGTLFGPSPANESRRNFYLPVAILTKITLPLQGMWNCFIYIRPRYNALRVRNPDISAWAVLKLVVMSDDPSSVDHSASARVSAFGAMSRRFRSGSFFAAPNSSRSPFGSRPPMRSNKEPSSGDTSSNKHDNNNASRVNVVEEENSQQQQQSEIMDIDDFMPEFNNDETISPFEEDNSNPESRSLEMIAGEQGGPSQYQQSDVDATAAATATAGAGAGADASSCHF